MPREPVAPGDRLLELQRRLRDDPASMLFAPLAQEYRSAGRMEEAERTLRDGLRRHPDHHAAAAALGRVLLEQGRVEEAREVLERVAARIPDNLLAVRLLGEIEAASPPRGPARPVAPAPPPVSARAAAPPRRRDDLVTGTLAEIYLAQGDRERGLALLRELARREPDNPRWRERIAGLVPAPPAAAPTGSSAAEPLPEDLWEEGSVAADAAAAPTLAARAEPVPRGAAGTPGTPALEALRRYLAKVERHRRGNAV